MLREFLEAVFGDGWRDESNPPAAAPPPREKIEETVRRKRAYYRKLKAGAIEDGDTELLEYLRGREIRLDLLEDEAQRMQQEYDVFRSERPVERPR